VGAIVVGYVITDDRYAVIVNGLWLLYVREYTARHTAKKR